MSTEAKCTCPSGDGSLRWPCPTHRPALTTNACTVTSLQPFEAGDIVFGHPRELFRVTPAGDVVVKDGVTMTEGARAFLDEVARMRPRPPASGEFDRARETPRRQSAVELLLSLGYVWRTDRWEAPQAHAAAGVNEPFGNSEQLAQPDAAGGLNEQSGNSGQLQADEMRAEFEAWAVGSGYYIQRSREFGFYESSSLRLAWEAWQAALAACQPVGQEPVGCGACNDACAARSGCEVAEQSPPIDQGPIAEIVEVGGIKKLRVHPDGGLPSLLNFPTGTKFYTAPPAPAAVPVDLSKFRNAVLHACHLATVPWLAEQLADLLQVIDSQPAATEREEDGWIDVSERKPEHAQEVLFVLDGKTVAGAWIGGIFWYSNQKRAALWWQPFPKPRIGAATHPQPAAAKEQP